MNLIVEQYLKYKSKRKQELQQEKDRIQQELKEDLKQCRVNVRYLNASINVYRSNSKTIKGDGAADTRKKRETAKKILNWYIKKLEEEKALINYFTRLTG